MSLVITRQPWSTRGRDTVLDRAVCLVPIEVITIYTAALALATGVAAQVLFFAGVVATPLVLALLARRQRVTASLAQHVVRVLSFIAWAFVVANPLAPAAPIARWIPAVSIIVLPALGSLLFPPAEAR